MPKSLTTSYNPTPTKRRRSASVGSPGARPGEKRGESKLKLKLKLESTAQGPRAQHFLSFSFPGSSKVLGHP